MILWYEKLPRPLGRFLTGGEKPTKGWLDKGQYSPRINWSMVNVSAFGIRLTHKLYQLGHKRWFLNLQTRGKMPARRKSAIKNLIIKSTKYSQCYIDTWAPMTTPRKWSSPLFRFHPGETLEVKKCVEFRQNHHRSHIILPLKRKILNTHETCFVNILDKNLKCGSKMTKCIYTLLCCPVKYEEFFKQRVSL